jgi:hypothetical protein
MSCKSAKAKTGSQPCRSKSYSACIARFILMLLVLAFFHLVGSTRQRSIQFFWNWCRCR